VAYQAFRQAGEYFGSAYDDVLSAVWLLVYIPVLLCAWYGVSAGIGPIALAIAGCLTLLHFWGRGQADREVSGLVVVASIMWAFAAAGLHNAQIYTHILAATFGLYAYWRWRLGDRDTSDEYLYAMLGTATIPLILQAVGGQAGGLYGWWLLLEQVAFMLLGISIRRRFVTYWGLYVAIGAVLYQLRNLGWAALSFLALFIIGMAMYRLLRSTDHRA
jgi:hypothetical protein